MTGVVGVLLAWHGWNGRAARVAPSLAGKAAPKDDDVPPAAAPAMMLTRRLPLASTCSGAMLVVVNVPGDV